MFSYFTKRTIESDYVAGRNYLPVSKPVLWPCDSSIFFYKTPENSQYRFMKDGYSDLFGRAILIIGKAKRETFTVFAKTNYYSCSFASVPGMSHK